jgi:citrate lyase synthetase
MKSIKLDGVIHLMANVLIQKNDDTVVITNYNGDIIKSVTYADAAAATTVFNRIATELANGATYLDLDTLLSPPASPTT